MRVYIHAPGDSAQAYYRGGLPAKFCSSEDVRITCAQSLAGIDYDVFWLPRLLAQGFVSVVEALKKQGKKIIFETDDDLWHIPLWNPACKVYGQTAIDVCDWTADVADAIVVSTEPLKDVVGRPAKTVVLPNLIDLDDWPELPAQEAGPLRILWAGSQHHEKDLEEIVQPLDRILEEFGDRVVVYWLGDWPTHFAEWARIRYSHLGRMAPHRRYDGRVGFIDPVSLKQYPATLCTIRPDIALAPLCNDKFNVSKSGIKYYEYALAGAAVVATNLPPYGCIDDGTDGLLVKTGDAQGWYEAIKRLIENERLRSRLAAAARAKVFEEYSWQHSPAAESWQDFFRSLQ